MRMSSMAKKSSLSFEVGDLIVYPSHGVGRIVSIGVEVVHGINIELVSIRIEEDKLTLKVPKSRAGTSGLRTLVDRPLAERALRLMTGRPRGKSGTWNRRAQEYERKIHSGDLLLVAEVVRDLRAKAGSYSERQLYERALNRAVLEIGSVLGCDPKTLRADIDKQADQAAA